MDSQVNMNPSDAPQGEGAPVEKEQTALFYTTVDPIDPKEIKIYEKITFTETPTFNLLNIPQSRLFDEDPMVEQVVAKNKKYLEICKTKLGNDSFVDRGINTFNDLPKIKNTQTERITISEKGAWCTLWDMYDSNLNDSEKKDGDEGQVVSKEAVVQTDSPAQQTSVKKSVATGTITNTVMSEMPSETGNILFDYLFNIRIVDFLLQILENVHFKSYWGMASLKSKYFIKGAIRLLR